MNENNNKLAIPQFYIIKLKTEDILNSPKDVMLYNIKGKELKSKAYNVAGFGMAQAREKGKLISVADHPVFKEIREFKNNFASQKQIYNHVKILRNEIKILKSIKDPKRAINASTLLQEVLDELNEYQFVPEVISVVNKKSKYKSYSKGFYFGGEFFTRNQASTGNLKSNIVLFVRDDINQKITRKIQCGHNPIDEKGIIAPPKYGAYFGLSTTGTVFIKSPRVLVVPDFSYNISDMVNYVQPKKDEQGNDIKDEYEVIKKPYNDKLKSFDGMGLCSPEWAKIVAKKELGLDYIPSAFNMRCNGIKGLVVTFDFKSYCFEYGTTNFIKDIKNKEININDVDIILTESQWKWHSLYDDDWERFAKNHEKFNQTWGVQRVAPKVDSEHTRLNYQLLQTSNIQENSDIDELLQPTKEYFQSLAECNNIETMYHLLKDRLVDDEIDEYKGTITNMAILKNKEMLNDAYVKEEIQKSIQGAIKEAKTGKIICHGNYSFMISDPVALAQWVIHRDVFKVHGLIPPNKVYSKFWTDRNVKKIDACRSPMTDIAEHNILEVICYDEIIKLNENKDSLLKEFNWYEYIYSGLIYSIKDMSTVIHADSDFDSDCVLSTNMEVLIRCKYGNTLPVTYDAGKDKMLLKSYNIKAAVESDLQGFGNQVGRFSNMSTSYFAMLPLFEGEKKQRIFDNIKILRYIIGQEIDSTKTGVKPTLPLDFVWKPIKYSDDEYNKNNQAKRNELAPHFMPYFFRYCRDDYDKKFTKYCSYMKIVCQKFTFITLDKLLSIPEDKLTTEQKDFKQIYIDNSPLLLTNCVINKICWSIEKFENEVLKGKFKLIDNNYVLLSYAEDINISELDKSKILSIYRDYQKEFSEFTRNINVASKENNKVKKAEMMDKKNILKDCAAEKLYLINTNTKELFEMVVKALKNEDKKKVNKFIWKIFDEDILDVIPQSETKLMVKKCEYGKGTNNYLWTGLEVEENINAVAG